MLMPYDPAQRLSLCRLIVEKYHAKGGFTSYHDTGVN